MHHEPMRISVFFDFLCPFAYRTTIWLSGLHEQINGALEITWRYYSLEQSHAAEHNLDWRIWEQQDDYTPVREQFGADKRGLLGFWAAEAARQQSPAAFDRFRVMLYHAFHRDRRDISQRATVSAVAAEAELDMAAFERDFQDRRLLEAVQRDFTQAREQYNVFGVPTICFDERNAVFVKMNGLPAEEDAIPFFHDLRREYTTRSWLLEVKRPTK